MKKIVVIDDEPMVLMLVEEKLKRAGFEVVTYRKSAGAIELIRNERPDLVIMDWMLPETSGLELSRQLHEDAELSGIPVFMVSAKGAAEEKAKAMGYGVVKFITKPFSPKALLEEVMSTLGIKIPED